MKIFRIVSIVAALLSSPMAYAQYPCDGLKLNAVAPTADGGVVVGGVFVNIVNHHPIHSVYLARLDNKGQVAAEKKLYRQERDGAPQPGVYKIDVVGERILALLYHPDRVCVQAFDMRLETDTSFGEAGESCAELPVAGFEDFEMDAQHNIYATGSMFDVETGDYSTKTVQKLTPEGDIDLHYGEGSVADSKVGLGYFSAALSKNGRYGIQDRDGTVPTAVFFDSNGDVDMNFLGGGQHLAPHYKGHSWPKIMFDDQNRLYLSQRKVIKPGTVYWQFKRFKENGVLDTSFGHRGVIDSKLVPSMSSLKRVGPSKFLLAPLWDSQRSDYDELRMYHDNGALVRSFGRGGVLVDKYASTAVVSKNGDHILLRYAEIAEETKVGLCKVQAVLKKHSTSSGAQDKNYGVSGKAKLPKVF